MESAEEASRNLIGGIKSTIQSKLRMITNPNASSSYDLIESKSYKQILVDISAVSTKIENLGCNQFLEELKEYVLKTIYEIGDDNELKNKLNEKYSSSKILGNNSETFIDQQLDSVLDFLNALSAMYNHQRTSITYGTVPASTIFSVVHLYHPLLRSTYLYLLEDNLIDYVPYNIYQDILKGESKIKLNYRGTTVSHLSRLIYKFVSVNVFPKPGWDFYQSIIFKGGKSINFQRPPKPKFTQKEKKDFRQILENILLKKK